MPGFLRLLRHGTSGCHAALHGCYLAKALQGIILVKKSKEDPAMFHYSPPQQPAMCSLADKLLDVTAGMPVDPKAFHQHSLNLAKLKTLAVGYKQGWLHNLMGRITPYTLRSPDDYVMMADLFVPNAESAQALLSKMSADMTAFATTAGLAYTAPEMSRHRELYQRLSTMLGSKFGVETPAPFASTVFRADQQAHMAFVRGFLRSRAA